MLRNTIDEFTHDRDVFYRKTLLNSGSHVGPQVIETWIIPIERVEKKFVENGRMTRIATVEATEGEWRWGPRDLEGITIKRKWNDVYKRDEYIISRVTFVDGEAERAKWKAFDREHGITNWRTLT